MFWLSSRRLNGGLRSLHVGIAVRLYYRGDIPWQDWTWSSLRVNWFGRRRITNEHGLPPGSATLSNFSGRKEDTVESANLMHPVQSIQRNDDAQESRADRVEELLNRCARRDAQALEDLYQLVSPQLYGLLLRMLHRPSLAEDALQDVMIRVWQRAGQYSAHRGRAMAWLISITRYRAIDLVRGQRESAALDEVPQDLLTDPSIEDLSETTTSRRSKRALRECLGRLSSDQRRCIELAYVDGYSHGEIAEKVGSPPPTVRSWMRRGLASLKRCLDS